MVLKAKWIRILVHGTPHKIGEYGIDGLLLFPGGPFDPEFSKNLKVCLKNETK
jgi:hypothetical protein